VTGGHEHPPVVEECHDLLRHFSSFPSCFEQLVWCVSGEGGNNLGLQATKPILFLTAYKGFRKCTLCWSSAAGQVVNF